MSTNNGTACFNCNKAYLNCLNYCPHSPMKLCGTKASENQVRGKKPVYNCIRGALCPVCDGELYPKFVYVRRFKHEEIRIKEKTPYCKHCGHALDWGKESEVAKRREDIENSPVDCSTPSVTDQKGEGE